MPSAPTIFEITNTLVLPCWLALAVSLFWPASRAWIWRVTGILVPALYGAIYVVMIIRGFGEAPEGGFASIGEVRALFASDAALTAGWIHYLAFDLLVGTLIARLGSREGLYPLLLLLCLPLTFMTGPAGFLLFTLLRLGRRGLARSNPA